MLDTLLIRQFGMLKLFFIIGATENCFGKIRRKIEARRD